MDNTYTLSGETSILTSDYNPPRILEEGKKYALGLIHLQTYHSYSNVDHSNNKLHFITQSGEKAMIAIPEGSYEIDDINKYLSKALIQYVKNESKDDKFGNNFKKGRLYPPVLKIEGNNTTLKTELKCTLDIDFTPKDSIGTLLGFKPRKLKANVNHESDSPAKITKINVLCVECNIISGSYRNGKEVHIIHEFFPLVPPGFKIVEIPSNVIYLPINTKQINEIILKITDQNGNLVSFRGEEITVRLHLREL